jgi:hypothetical protein
MQKAKPVEKKCSKFNTFPNPVQNCSKVKTSLKLDPGKSRGGEKNAVFLKKP